jgi:hypothetical protein
MIGDENASATSLQFPDNLFGCKLGVKFGHGIIRRHGARYRLALNEGA